MAGTATIYNKDNPYRKIFYNEKSEERSTLGDSPIVYKRYPNSVGGIWMPENRSVKEQELLNVERLSKSLSEILTEMFKTDTARAKKFMRGIGYKALL